MNRTAQQQKRLYTTIFGVCIEVVEYIIVTIESQASQQQPHLGEKDDSHRSGSVDTISERASLHTLDSSIAASSSSTAREQDDATDDILEVIRKKQKTNHSKSFQSTTKVQQQYPLADASPESANTHIVDTTTTSDSDLSSTSTSTSTLSVLNSQFESVILGRVEHLMHRILAIARDELSVASPCMRLELTAERCAFMLQEQEKLVARSSNRSDAELGFLLLFTLVFSLLVS